MRILITTGIFKPEPGGPATYAAELARRLHATGHTVKIITYSNNAQENHDVECSFPIIRVVRSNNKIGNYCRYFLAVYKELAYFDFVYSLDWFSAGVPVMCACYLRHKKYVVRVGGGYIWEKYLADGNPAITLKDFYKHRLYNKYKILYVLIKKVLQHASHVVFNSDEQKFLYIKYYNLKKEKVDVIYNAVPENKLGALVQNYKHYHRVPDKEIVFAGRFIKMKNVESLIRAFAALSDTSFTLLLIGEGPTEHELKNLTVELGILERVTFMKPMPLQDLYRRIVNCYYVVLPSWTDISPHQIYECMALGIPFLLTKENYLSINKKDFLKIDPASVEDISEKMNWLADPVHYYPFVESLSHLVFKHSWNDVLVEHIQLFNQV